ncbi:MAG: hypothetical protein WC538_11685 [Thermoanaerobaculia bacterium]
MSRSNGERSLADITRKRRTAQRVKDRALRASLGVKPAAVAETPAAAPAKKAAKPAKG